MRANPGDIFATPHGRQVRLDTKIADGGEGTVFNIVGDSNVVAKTYHNSIEKNLADKLAAMTCYGRVNPALFEFAAWPKELLLDKSHTAVVGFLMQKFVGYRSIHQLYGPKDRQTYFPDADWGFLVHAALNCSIAFEAIHSRGHVIGDVNHSNVFVNNTAMVKLIDCDSMGMRDVNRWFPCSEVGVVDFTAPELQGVSLTGIQRTQNHDLFGLAVIIFHLLLCRHPFMGVLRVPNSFESPEIGSSIASSDFAYSQSRQTKLIPVKNWPLLDCLSSDIAELFERAFDAPAPGAPPQRPAAKAWADSLRRFEKSLKKCSKNGGHRYYAKNKDCPWCSIISSRGYDFFVTADSTLSAWSPEKADITRLLAALRSLLAISDELKESGAPFRPRLPTPLPCRSIECPTSPGPPPDENTLPAGLSDKPVLPMVVLAPPKFFPYPSEPKPKVLRPPEMLIRKVAEPFWTRVSNNARSFWQRGENLLILLFVLILSLILPGFFGTAVIVYSSITLFTLWRTYDQLRREDLDIYFKWREECRLMQEAHSKQVAKQAECYEAEKVAWQTKCEEIRSLNEPILEEHERQLKQMEEHRRTKQAELETQWEADNHLVLERWRRQLQVEKINWVSRKAEYDRLHSEYLKNRKILADEREKRRLAVEALTREVASLEASLNNQDLHEIERLKQSLSVTTESFNGKWVPLQQQFKDEVKASENIEQQLEDFLRIQPLPRDLTGVGPVLYNSLISAGITSAAECNLKDLLNVHGIGEKKAAVMMKWADEMKRAFKPRKNSVPTPQRLRINAKFGTLTAKLAAELESQSSMQTQKLNQARQSVRQKHSALITLKQTLTQAKVDYSPFN